MPGTQHHVTRANRVAKILSQMILRIFFEAYDSYWKDGAPEQSNIGKALVQWLVSMALRVNSENGMPVTISQVARTARMPRINCKRHLEALMDNNVVLVAGMEGDGYRTNPDYAVGRMPHFERMIDAVLEAAEELRALR
jgi:hypothetical protein